MHFFRANMLHKTEDPRAVCVFVSPVLIPSSTDCRVDSIETYAYSCRICLLEFLSVFRLKNKKKIKITVIHDISKQIEQHTRIGKIFARWHFAIATTSIMIIYFLCIGST